MASNTLIAMVGLPRSGKSTISRELSRRFGAPVVNRDSIRLAVHGQRYVAAAEPLIKALDIYMVRALFGAGHEIVIADETNFSKAARNHLADPNWTTVFYHVGTDKLVCMERAVKTEQSDLLPVIEEMANRWEPFEDSDFIYEDSWQPTDNWKLAFASKSSVHWV